MCADNLLLLLLMTFTACFAGGTFYVSLLKLRQDSWAKRYDYYLRANNYWGPVGKVDLTTKECSLEKYVKYEKKREKARGQEWFGSQAEQQLEEIKEEIIRKNFNDDDESKEMLYLFNKASFLFDQDTNRKISEYHEKLLNMNARYPTYIHIGWRDAHMTQFFVKIFNKDLKGDFLFEWMRELRNKMYIFTAKKKKTFSKLCGSKK